MPSSRANHLTWTNGLYFEHRVQLHHTTRRSSVHLKYTNRVINHSNVRVLSKRATTENPHTQCFQEHAHHLNIKLP